MTYILGGDYSHWNSPDWAELVAQGHKFAWIKCTEGTTFKDPRYLAHLAAAKSAGLLVGPYHYFRAAYDGTAQAEHLFKAAIGNLSLPPAIDVESRNNGGFSQKLFASTLQACVERTESLFGRKPIIYTSQSMWGALAGFQAWAGAHPLWVAHYSTATTAPLIPSSWNDWQVWQFTSTPLDTNRMRQEFWNSLTGAPQEPVVVKLTAPRSADRIEITLS